MAAPKTLRWTATVANADGIKAEVSGQSLAPCTVSLRERLVREYSVPGKSELLRLSIEDGGCIISYGAGSLRDAPALPVPVAPVEWRLADTKAVRRVNPTDKVENFVRTKE